MDLHIDKKTGLLLGIMFVLGGIVGGLIGVVAGHHRNEFREFGGRDGLPVMDGYRHGGNLGQEEGYGSRGGFRGVTPGVITPLDTRIATAPTPVATTTKTN